MFVPRILNILEETAWFIPQQHNYVMRWQMAVFLCVCLMAARYIDLLVKISKIFQNNGFTLNNVGTNV
jgi:hypothetical protein